MSSIFIDLLIFRTFAFSVFSQMYIINQTVNMSNKYSDKVIITKQILKLWDSGNENLIMN